MGGGVATAALPFDPSGLGRQAPRSKAFAALTAPVQVPEREAVEEAQGPRHCHRGAPGDRGAAGGARRGGADRHRYRLHLRVCPDLWPGSGADCPDDGDRTRERRPRGREGETDVCMRSSPALWSGSSGMRRSLFGRDGQVVGRYYKIAKTHPEMISGEETPVFETDFGQRRHAHLRR